MFTKPIPTLKLVLGVYSRRLPGYEVAYRNFAERGSAVGVRVAAGVLVKAGVLVSVMVGVRVIVAVGSGVSLGLRVAVAVGCARAVSVT